MSIKRVTTRAIEDSQITSAKIADESITSGKIANSAVESAKIASGAVDATKLADNAVTVGKITDGAVSLNKLAANSVDAGKIADGAVTPAKLSTAGPSWNSAGGTFTLSQGAIELGTGIESNNPSFIDFHSSFPLIDFDARITRQSGVNGILDIVNAGNGSINFTSTGGFKFANAPMPNPAGNAPIFGARAWVNFNGSGTVAIRASGNVSSITDGGTGAYTVNFTTAMLDTNYSVTVTARRIDANNANFSATLKGTTSANTNYPLSTTSCEVICGTPSNNAFVDSDVVCVSVFR
jgi:hypothetical protein